MKKVFVVTRSVGREPLLEALREVGVVHLQPVDPAASAPEKLRAALGRTQRAQRIIASTTPAGKAPALDADSAAREILGTARRIEESRTRLAAVHREAQRIRLWGDSRLAQLKVLAEAGVKVSFYSVPAKQAGEVRGDCVAALAELPGKRVLIAVAQRQGEPALPRQAQFIEPPQRDRPAILAEAKQLDQALAEDAQRLAGLARLADALEAERRRLAAEVEFAAALAGGMQGEELFAVQGWSPADSAATLAAELTRRGIAAGVTAREPAADEQPPTLIHYPRWARPIKGLFDMLKTSPGYRELDVTGAFMVALPIFAAMLIADGGYGLLFLLLPLLFYRKVAAKAGANTARLVIVIGGLSVIWGVISASFFGVSGEALAGAGGMWRPIGEMLLRLRIVRVEDSSDAMTTLMNVCFIMGAIHLSIAHLWRSLTFFPHLKFLGRLGWACFLWGMLGVVRYYVLGFPFGWSLAYPYLLIVGGALAVLFAAPQRNVLKMLLQGLANFPLSAIGTFSDIISYVRLAAVGLASSVLAVSFNQLAFSAGFLPATVLILLLGHALNVGLCIIALFAHGLRLNMLEFSSNLGVEWAGYDYEPFAKKAI